MMYPKIFTEDLFDDWFDDWFPEPRWNHETEKKLYGKHANMLMRTDVREHDDKYEVDIDLPGFHKDQLKLALNEGYLTITASKGLDEDEKNKEGKLIRQERYSGTMQRSFYVGENIAEEDIKAKYEDGVLRLTFPKKETKKLPKTSTIAIE